MTADDTARYIVVGVTPQQPLTVVRQAARFARQFQAALVCANVEAGSYGSIQGRASYDGALTQNLSYLISVLGRRSDGACV